jgi:6-pyruvoyltetrahydropterin/6-carboxytetrahydropterin synthase
MNRKIAIYRKEHFNAAHRLHNPQLSDAENAAVYGRCNYPNYHGHNYELIVRVTGEVDPVTGFVMDMKTLGKIVRENVLERFDHKNLNLDTDEFRERIPTAENIAMVIHDLLRGKISDHLDLKVILYETERNFVEFPG